jgi:hypothetical protein
VVSRVAPIGLRFRDAATGALGIDGLRVVAYPEGDPARQVSAVRSPSCVYVLSGLPGLRAWENGAGDDDFWKQPLPAARFTAEVSDPAGRYLPARLTGLTASRWRLDAMPDPVSLYPAPAAPVPPGTAVVRAQLFDPVANAYAAWAVLEADYNGAPIATGVADEKGRVLLPFVYPRAPVPPLPAKPPPYTAATWPLTFVARYPLPAPATSPPDLAGILKQPVAKLWQDKPGGIPLGEAQLTYGSELVLRSPGADGNPPPYLLITPA